MGGSVDGDHSNTDNGYNQKKCGKNFLSCSDTIPRAAFKDTHRMLGINNSLFKVKNQRNTDISDHHNLSNSIFTLSKNKFFIQYTVDENSRYFKPSDSIYQTFTDGNSSAIKTGDKMQTNPDGTIWHIKTMDKHLIYVKPGSTENDTKMIVTEQNKWYI
jgi:hypothetical protein